MVTPGVGTRGHVMVWSEPLGRWIVGPDWHRGIRDARGLGRNPAAILALADGCRAFDQALPRWWMVLRWGVPPLGSESQHIQRGSLPSEQFHLPLSPRTTLSPRFLEGVYQPGGESRGRRPQGR